MPTFPASPRPTSAPPPNPTAPWASPKALRTAPRSSSSSFAPPTCSKSASPSPTRPALPGRSSPPASAPTGIPPRSPSKLSVAPRLLFLSHTIHLTEPPLHSKFPNNSSPCGVVRAEPRASQITLEPRNAFRIARPKAAALALAFVTVTSVSILSAQEPKVLAPHKPVPPALHTQANGTALPSLDRWWGAYGWSTQISSPPSTSRTVSKLRPSLLRPSFISATAESTNCQTLRWNLPVLRS